jgi:uncharacterized caspase-like protein
MRDTSRGAPALSSCAQATRRVHGLPAVVLLALVALVTVLGAGAALAQDRQERRVALIVGNSNYRDPMVEDLKNPVRDAAAMQIALQPLGFQLFSWHDLTHQAFQEKIAEFTKAIKGADVALFFYAGHGVQFDNKNYLLPTDVDLKSKKELLTKSILLDKLLEDMGQYAKASVIFLDACRDSPKLRSVGGTERGILEYLKGLAPISENAASSDLFVGFAAAPGTSALDGGGGNSPFTAALRRNIATPDVEIGAMFASVRRDVLNATRKRQKPESLSRLTHALYLNPQRGTGQAAPAPTDGITPGLFEGDDAPAVRLSPEAERWWPIKDSSDPRDFEDFLREYPKGNFALVAKRKYDQLAKLARPGDSRPAPSTAPAEPHAAEGELVEVAATARITKGHPKEEAQRSARALARARAILKVYGANAGLPNFVSSSAEASELLGHMTNGVTYEEEWVSTQNDKEIRLKLKAKVRLLRPEKDRRLTGQINPPEVVSGQPFHLRVDTSKDATVGIFAWQAGSGDGTVVRLYPETARKPVLLKAGEPARFPRNGDAYPGLAAGNPPGEKRNHEALLVVTGSTNIRFDELVPIAVAESLQQAAQQESLDATDFLRKLAGIRDSELEMLVLPYEVLER